MDTIAVVDDREEMRGTVARLIRLDLEELQLDWRVISIAPLSDLNDYAAWIQENEVCVLVLDENLSEEHVAGQDAANYTGHAVASLLRQQKPDLPQFIITSVAIDQDLEASSHDLEDIIAREKFTANSGKFVQRMVRAGQSFVARYESDLAQLTRIAEAVVQENVTTEDLDTANAIRTKLQLAYNVDEIKSMQDWLVKAEAAAARLEGAIEKLLKKNNASKR